MLKYQSLRIIVLYNISSNLFSGTLCYVVVTEIATDQVSAGPVTCDSSRGVEEGVTGGDSGEQLPMVLKVPYLSNDPSRVCYDHYIRPFRILV